MILLYLCKYYYRAYTRILGHDCVFDELETYMKDGIPDPFTYVLHCKIVFLCIRCCKVVRKLQYTLKVKHKSNLLKTKFVSV